MIKSFGCAPIVILVIVAAILLLAAYPLGAAAGGRSSLYGDAILRKDAKRLQTAVQKICNLGIKPKLTPAETTAIGPFQFRFPMPRAGDDPLNVYASYSKSRAKMVMPILSLKTLEDLTTAYAWLYASNNSLSTIDLYFAMRRYQRRSATKAGGLPVILQALKIPADALANKKTDRLALGLRNEAFAFLMLHELGHIRFRHGGLQGITKARARADEAQADRFALDVMARTGTPPLGAVLYFQALLYSDPHRGQFKTKQAWQDYLLKTSTHPLTTDRLKAMAEMIGGPLAQRRGKEGYIWRDISLKLLQIITIMEDVELQRCIAKVAAKGDRGLLQPRKTVAGPAMRDLCSVK